MALLVAQEYGQIVSRIQVLGYRRKNEAIVGFRRRTVTQLLGLDGPGKTGERASGVRGWLGGIDGIIGADEATYSSTSQGRIPIIQVLADQVVGADPFS